MTKRAYIQYSEKGDIIAGSVILRYTKPTNGIWVEVPTKNLGSFLQTPWMINTDNLPLVYSN